MEKTTCTLTNVVQFYQLNVKLVLKFGIVKCGLSTYTIIDNNSIIDVFRIMKLNVYHVLK